MREPERSQRAYISVGSNIEPEANVARSLEILSRLVPISAVSTFYRTEPVGMPGAPVFLNGVCVVDTETQPRALKFRTLRAVEERLGRVRTEDRYAPRVIDLDILLYGDCVIDEPGLTIPDPDLERRPFLALAVLELAPELIVPGRGVPLKTITEKRSSQTYTPEVAFTTALRQRLAL